MSDYQVAAALLGLPGIIRTDPYNYLNVQGAGNYDKWLEQENQNNDTSDSAFARQNDAIDLAERNEDGPQGATGSTGDDKTNEQTVPAEMSGPQNNLYAGPIKLYELREDPSDEDSDLIKVPVKLASYFANRGEQLRNLTRLEYAALIQIQKVKDPMTSTKRKQNFPFAVNHILHPTHAQQLRAKQCTVIVCTKPPPHPGAPPEDDDEEGRGSNGTPGGEADTISSRAKWKKKADAFAKYVLLLCRPEPCCYSDEHTNTYTYDWESLTTWMSDMRNDTSMLSKFRLVSIFRRFCDLKCSVATGMMLSHYRRRGRDWWTKNKSQIIAREMEQDEERTRRANITASDPISQMLFEEEHMHLSKRVQKQTTNALACEEGESRAFLRCLPTMPAQDTDAEDASTEPGSASTASIKESSSFRFTGIYE
ncbi:MAG: hypothetical protein SGARI_006097, partial [Bacillariaceae sp.]